jgi:hypothetical protein
VRIDVQLLPFLENRDASASVRRIEYNEVHGASIGEFMEMNGK